MGCAAPITTAHPDLPALDVAARPTNLGAIAAKNLATSKFPGTRRMVGVNDRRGDAGLIRGLRCADHDRAPRPPALDVVARTNQPRFHRDPKFEKSRDPEFSWHAPNSRRDRLTERSTGVQVCYLTKIGASRYRDFGRPRLELVLELY